MLYIVDGFYWCVLTVILILPDAPYTYTRASRVPARLAATTQSQLNRSPENAGKVACIIGGPRPICTQPSALRISTQVPQQQPNAARPQPSVAGDGPTFKSLVDELIGNLSDGCEYVATYDLRMQPQPALNRRRSTPQGNCSPSRRPPNSSSATSASVRCWIAPLAISPGIRCSRLPWQRRSCASRCPSCCSCCSRSPQS